MSVTGGSLLLMLRFGGTVYVCRGCSCTRGKIETVKSLVGNEILVKGTRLPAESCSRTVEAFKLKILGLFENLTLGATPIRTLVSPAVGVFERTFSSSPVV